MTLTPMWKKVAIDLQTKTEHKVGSIILPTDVKDVTRGYSVAKVVNFCPLAGTDSRSGFRFHTFVVGETVIVNNQHIIKVMFKGKQHYFVNDIFIVAYDGPSQSHAALQSAEVPEAELESTIGMLDDIHNDQVSLEDQ